MGDKEVFVEPWTATQEERYFSNPPLSTPSHILPGPEEGGELWVCAEALPMQLNYLIDEGMSCGKGSSRWSPSCIIFLALWIWWAGCRPTLWQLCRTEQEPLCPPLLFMEINVWAPSGGNSDLYAGWTHKQGLILANTLMRTCTLPLGEITPQGMDKL